MFQWLFGRKRALGAGGASVPPGSQQPTATDPDDGGDMRRETLAAIVRGIHHAASSSQQMLAQQYVVMLGQFFDELPADDPDLGPKGTLIAKTVRVQIDQKHYSTVPLISLMAPRGIYLAEMRVNFSMRIEETQAKEATSAIDNLQAERTSFQVVLSPRSEVTGTRRSDVTDVEVFFKAMPPAEGMMRLIDQFTTSVTPRSNDKPPPIKMAQGTELGMLWPEEKAPPAPQA